MKITIQLDDDLFEAYRAMGNGSIQSTIKVVEEQLKRFSSIGRNERVIVLAGDDRRALEKIFQTTIDSAADLVRRVTGLSKFQIGDVVRPFTEGELITLTEQARFHGKAPDDYARTVAEDVLARTFDRI